MGKSTHVRDIVQQSLTGHAALASRKPLLYENRHEHAHQQRFPSDRFFRRDRARARFDPASSRPYRRSPGSLKERPAVDPPRKRMLLGQSQNWHVTSSERKSGKGATRQQSV